MRRLLAAGIPLLAILLLEIAQLVLPGLAASRLRGQLGRYGTVLSVNVHAFPAVELLWHQADRVTVRLAGFRSSVGELASLLAQLADAGSVSASAQTVQAGLLTARDATLAGHGRSVLASAQVDVADLRRALPILRSVQPVPSAPGTLTLRGTATLLGVSATVDATVAARSGAIVVTPDVPFGALATITAFSSPHVYVESLSATPDAGGFRVSATARVR